jgi:hypothetical protein
MLLNNVLVQEKKWLYRTCILSLSLAVVIVFFDVVIVQKKEQNYVDICKNRTHERSEAMKLST